jgi:histidyl-tRNA synthetase
LQRNPLRILDSKDEGDRALIANAPRMAEYLTVAAREYFKTVLGGLAGLGLPAQVNERIVRGLDYYNHTVFEFTTDQLGTQGSVIAGGRYDGLIELMGGPATPGVGWGAGIDRLMMLIADTPPAIKPIAVVPMGELAEAEALKLTQRLRAAKFHVELGYKGNLAKRMKKADKLGAVVALILGDTELAKGVVMLKDLKTGEQREVPLSELERALAPYHDTH